MKQKTSKTLYIVAATTSLIAFSLSACNNDKKAQDTTITKPTITKPTPSKPINKEPNHVYLISLSSTTKGDITASWLPAKDDTTPSDQLIYELHAGDSADFTPSDKSKIYSAKNKTSAKVLDKLTGGKRYFIKLVVIDKDGKKGISKALAVNVSSKDPVTNPGGGNTGGGNTPPIKPPSVVIKNPIINLYPTTPIKGKPFEIYLTGGSSDSFYSAKWIWNEGSKNINNKADIYKSLNITSNKNTIDLKINLYNQNGERISTVNKKITLVGIITPKITASGIKKCVDASSNMLDCNPATLVNWYGLKQDGEVLAGDSMSYTRRNHNGEECVKDNITGLVWEKKTPSGSGELRDATHTYSWYQPTSIINGGDPGQQNKGSCLGSSCDTYSYIQALNDTYYCGYNDWRLPTIDELVSIVDYGRYNPAINPIFNDTQSKDYWSINALYNSAWSLNFKHGQDDNTNSKKSAHYIRAVRSE